MVQHRRNGRENGAAGPRPLWVRLAWLVVIWSASVLALGIVAWLIRRFMAAAGLVVP